MMRHDSWGDVTAPDPTETTGLKQCLGCRHTYDRLDPNQPYCPACVVRLRQMVARRDAILEAKRKTPPVIDPHPMVDSGYSPLHPLSWLAIPLMLLVVVVALVALVVPVLPVLLR